MTRFLSLVALSFALIACGGTTVDDEVNNNGNSSTETPNNSNSNENGGSNNSPDSNSGNNDSSNNNASGNNSSNNNEPEKPLVGDVQRGKTLWEDPNNSCKFCHAKQGNGTLGIGESRIDPKNLQLTDKDNLADYIERTMPNVDPSICSGQCAADTAAYLLFLADEQNGNTNTGNNNNAGNSDNAGNNNSNNSQLSGAQLYSEHGCAFCHGDDAQKSDQPIIFENWTQSALASHITKTMPPANPRNCEGECADKVATYILTLQPEISCTGDEAEPLPRRVRLLTNREYTNTVNDLLDINDADTVTALFETNTLVSGFENNASVGFVSNSKMETYWQAAKKLAAKANLQSIVQCGIQNFTQDINEQQLQSCGDQFLNNFGKNAFRRPLTNEEKTDYLALFKSGSNAEESLRATITAMLASANFLYRTEIGQRDGNNYTLTQYELASLLSYTFLGTMPDEQLMRAAQDNRLRSTNEIRTEVERLMRDNRVKEQLSYFGKQWLHLEKLSGLNRDAFPEFSDQVAGAMETELDLFLQELFLNDGYSMKDVFQSNFTYANQQLGQFYGISGANSQNFTKVNTDEKRHGLLSQGAVLANYSAPKESHPIRRGVFVRHSLLCQEFADPPANVGEIEPFDANKPTRERFAIHAQSENCASCHQHIDEVGFAFENYDAVGRFREYEGNNLSIDASGEISGLAKMTDIDTHSFNNLYELSNILAEEGIEHTAACLAENFHRYVEGVAEPDKCSVESTVDRWNSSSTEAPDLKNLWTEILASPNFMTRK